jgi:hypothetical protein
VSKDPQSVVDEWILASGVTLGSIIPNDLERDRVKRLLYTYREISATELHEIPPTDLYEHKIRLVPGTKPWPVPQQKRWAPAQKFWLDKTIKEGLRCGFFERTMAANGELSDWNAQAILVDKSEGSQAAKNEFRVTYNYRNVLEDIPGCFVVLMSETQDYISHPSHSCYFQMDLKHGYWSVPVYLPHRHMFAFLIPGVGQLQPTRLPQGSITSAFSFTELMYIVLGAIPPLQQMSGEFSPPEPSLLSADALDTLPLCKFYIDDIFSGTKDYQSAYNLLEQHLLPRLLWSKLKLLFKKLKLFISSIVALGIEIMTRGKVRVKPDRAKKIRSFPVPTSDTEVRRFIGCIQITRRWIKNFAELGRPLLGLTGKVK